jgi:hypothetical protein
LTNISNTRLFIVIILFYFFNLNLSANKLNDFEQAAKKEPYTNNSSKDSSNVKQDNSNIFGDFLFDIVGDFVTGTGKHSYKRATFKEVTKYNDSKMDVFPREYGEALIPILRLDSSFSTIDKNINSYSLRTEVGFGPFGVGRYNTYFYDKSTKTNLNLKRTYGLYRMSIGDVIEIDFGIGQAAVEGEEENIYNYITLPILFHPTKEYGLEYRISSAQNIVEEDIALMKKFQYGSIKLGYRILEAGDKKLDGFYLGFSLHY